MENNNNELVIIEKGVEVRKPASAFNRNVGEVVRRIQIKCKKVEKADGKGTFNSVSGYMYLDCYDYDGTPLGKHSRWLTMHFKKEAFEGAPTGCPNSPERLTSGFLYVRAKGIQAPFRYQVRDKKDKKGNIMYDENGESIKEYPNIWIKGDIVGFEAVTVEQDAFDYHETPKDAEVESVEVVDPETGEILEDASDEGIEIK